MQKTIFTSISALLFTCFGLQLQAQGCSDAGFCTLNNFKPADPETEEIYYNHLKAGISYGAADYDIAVLGTYFEYGHQINKKLSAEAKITTLYQQNDNVKAFGFSDVYLTAGYAIHERFRLTLGAKLPLNDGNRLIDETVVPMDFQSSLGTIDAIAGVSWQYKNLQATLALQQPLTQNNNQFLEEKLVGNSVFNGFQSSRLFKRSGDLMLRVSYAFALGSKLRLTPAILPIYHLANDEYTDDAGIRRVIEGSQGLTLNSNLFIDYQIKEQHNLQLSVGAPFVVREARPDGLTRSFIAGLEYKFRF
ncbi:MAG: hypothetical protein J0L99_18585 [Chitinophagales bacterium]|nr:hypothetical protein [Chitinophagales bacterium]